MYEPQNVSQFDGKDILGSSPCQCRIAAYCNFFRISSSLFSVSRDCKNCTWMDCLKTFSLLSACSLPHSISIFLLLGGSRKWKRSDPSRIEIQKKDQMEFFFKAACQLLFSTAHTGHDQISCTTTSLSGMSLQGSSWTRCGGLGLGLRDSTGLNSSRPLSLWITYICIFARQDDLGSNLAF